MNKDDKNRLPSWASIVLTIIMAIGASVAAYSARMYSTENDVEILEVKVNILQNTMVKTSDLLETINERTIRIEECMKTKADK